MVGLVVGFLGFGLSACGGWLGGLGCVGLARWVVVVLVYKKIYFNNKIIK